MESTVQEIPAAPLFDGDDLQWVGRSLSPGESFLFCRKLTRSHARSFYFASVALPSKKKDAAYSVYAFCRFVDDLLDENRMKTDEAKRACRSRLCGILRELYEQDEILLPFAPAFRQTVIRYQLPRQLFLELIEGVCMDAGRVEIENFKELHLYCYRVASVVGLMMARIFGLNDPAGEERAIQMGVAMQLTNILRDVREDLDKDRIYLPREELAAHRLTKADLVNGVVDERWRSFMAFQIDRARRYYRDGEKGISLLAADGSRLTVALMSRVYAGILEEIERGDYDVFTRRASVSFPRKLQIAWKTWRGLHGR